MEPLRRPRPAKKAPSRLLDLLGGVTGRYILFIGIGLMLVVMALFLRPVTKDADAVCEDIAARAVAASTPGPRSALDFKPPTEQEMNTLVECLQKRRGENR